MRIKIGLIVFLISIATLMCAEVCIGEININSYVKEYNSYKEASVKSDMDLMLAIDNNDILIDNINNRLNLLNNIRDSFKNLQEAPPDSVVIELIPYLLVEIINLENTAVLLLDRDVDKDKFYTTAKLLYDFCSHSATMNENNGDITEFRNSINQIRSRNVPKILITRNDLPKHDDINGYSEDILRHQLNVNYLAAAIVGKLVDDNNLQYMKLIAEFSSEILNDKDEAIKFYKKILVVSPNDIDSIIKLSNLLADKSDFETSLNLLTQAITRFKNNKDLIRGRISVNQRKTEVIGKSLDKSKDTVEAIIQDYNALMSLSPKDLTIYKEIADIIIKSAEATALEEFYIQVGQNGFKKYKPSSVVKKYSLKAIEYLDKAIKIKVNDHELYHLRFRAHSAFDSNTNALRDLTAAIKYNEKNWDYYSERASLHKVLGNYKDAINDYSEAIKLCDERVSPNYLKNLYSFKGFINLSIGNLTYAKDDFNSACTIVKVELYKKQAQGIDTDKNAESDLNCQQLEEVKASINRGEKWIEYASSGDTKFFYDKTSIVKKKNIVKLWCRLEQPSESKVEELKGNGQSYLTEKYSNYNHGLVNYEIRCNTQEMRTLGYVDYSDSGQVLDSSTFSSQQSEYKTVVPDSVGEALVERVCAKSP